MALLFAEKNKSYHFGTPDRALPEKAVARALKAPTILPGLIPPDQNIFACPFFAGSSELGKTIRR